MNLAQKDSGKWIQMLLLLASGGVVFLFVFIDALFPGMGYFLAEKYMAVPCLLFFGSALTQRQTTSAKLSLLLSTAAVLWFAVVQMQHHLMNMGVRPFGIFAFVYLLGFPFAAVTEDGRENRGLKWIGRIYIATALIIVIGTGLLMMDAVPVDLQAVLCWDGTRTAVLWHPNRSACALLLGIGFTLYFFAEEGNKRRKILLAVLVVLQFVALAMTNSRTSILLACGIVGGMVFLQIWKGSLKQFLTGLVVALAVIVLLFSVTKKLFDINSQYRFAKLLTQITMAEETAAELQSEEIPEDIYLEETPEEKFEIPNVEDEGIVISVVEESVQGGLLEDMKTLNSRTDIWGAAFEAMQDNPVIKRWGTEYVSAEISSRIYSSVAHAHNSWIQTWIQMGTVAFLIAMVYTLVAVFNALWLIFRKHVDIGKKIVAILVLCVLAAGFLESYLFVGEMPISFVNFIFFFCTGYLIQWNILASVKT